MANAREEMRGELLKMAGSLKTFIQSFMEFGRPLSSLYLKGEGNPPSPPLKKGSEGGFSSEKSPSLTLEEVRREIGDCQRCPLCRVRTNLVFGEGNPQANLVFVGEAPGEDEDRQGRPFVGRAGQLLTKIITAMKLTREDVYICNILKCRPPGNRNPKLDEIEACEPFLIRQLEAIRPKIICALGTSAAHTLLKTDVPITVLRGKFHAYHSIKLMPTYHPAYLLRNPGAKKQVWEDVKMIMEGLA
ncbi:MAG: uracil-DNA glycosylase [Syntrophales bacterium]|nr:uracil-DNA glycosylase [Syntrophales bacterium]